MQGSFYGNGFLQQMLAELPEEGVSFLTGELRGSETVIVRSRGDGYTVQGNAFESFEESALDIEAWLELASERGYSEIVLLGHSLGCAKVASYAAEDDHDLDSLVLLSPSDLRGTAVENSRVFGETMERARSLVDQGRGREIVTEDLWGWGYVSAETFVELFRPGGDPSMFDYSSPDRGFGPVKEIEIPTMAVFAENDTGVVTDPGRSLELLEEKMESCPRFEATVLENTGHTYAGKEEELIRRLLDFIG
jgi:pimeloyl-ACP methyl ester carboxylesterase